MIMRHDLLSDALCLIKNTENIGKDECQVPSSKLIKATLGIMKENGYIGDFKLEKTRSGENFVVTLLGKINNANAIKPRMSTKKEELPKYEKRFLPANGVGILILTTAKGIIDHKQAKKEGTGGKLLGFVY